MSKRKQKSKKRRKKQFPWFEEKEINIVGKKGDKIITDAGWEELTFESACQYFTPQEIRDEFQARWEGAEIEYLLAELGIDIDIEDEEAIEQFLENFDWTPKSIEVIVAKAVYDSHYYCRVVTIGDRDYDTHSFQNYEVEAIKLGVLLRQHLGRESDLPIVNDCKPAVIDARYSLIGWLPRKNVKVADRLKLSQATKIYSPSEWEEEWEDEELYYGTEEELVFDGYTGEFYPASQYPWW